MPKLIAMAVLAPVLCAQTDIYNASVEQLMQIHVRSVAKKDQTLARSAGAVFVLTREDIRRSGATSIPDLLRTAPGVQVARLDANAWAISIRGFNARYSNKVLVLIDGRTVYAPDFGGVFWDHQDLPLENIERIEVIRGPGGSLWGANAVNGVINITTRAATAAEGGLFSVGVGSDTRAVGLLQYGGSLGRKGAYRAFARFTDVANGEFPTGANAHDGWTRAQGGFRSDWDLSRHDSLTVQGDLFHNRGDQTRLSAYALGLPLQGLMRQPIDVNGGSVLARWNRIRSETSDLQLQVYFDHFARGDLGVVESVDTFDVDFQHRLTLGKHTDLVWGAGYRSTYSGAESPSPAFVGRYRRDPLYNAFLQDEIALSSQLSLTIGSKIEHNAYTGLEYEPSVRLTWARNARQTFWAAASRAIRQPSRLETSVEAELGRFPLDQGTEGILRLYANPNLQAEELRDCELGYRAQLTRSFSVDVAVYGGVYSHLQWTRVGMPAPISYTQVLIPLMFKNTDHGRTYGGEFFANWDVNSRWRIIPAYSFASLKTEPDRLTAEISTPHPAMLPPKHMVQIRSLFNLTNSIEFDTAIYRTSRLPDADIPGYTRVDARIGKRFGESGEVSLVGQNLLRPNHLEFVDHAGIVSSEAQRSVYAKLTWRF